jgi:hypothetical protein
VHGGDHLPWVQSGADDNFRRLRSLDWQVHVYGEIEQTVAAACDEFGLAAHVFAWSDAANHAGIKHNAMYLIRPDGHVALASSEQSVTKLRAFIERADLRFGGAVTENSSAVWGGFRLMAGSAVWGGSRLMAGSAVWGGSTVWGSGSDITVDALSLAVNGEE